MTEETFNIQLIDRTCQYMYRDGRKCGLRRDDSSGVHRTMVFVPVDQKPPELHRFLPSIAADLEAKLRVARSLVIEAYPAVDAADGSGLGVGFPKGTWTGWLIHAQALQLTPEDEEGEYSREGKCVRRYPKNRIKMCGRKRDEHGPETHPFTRTNPSKYPLRPVEE